MRSDTRRISKAIGRLREHFNEPLKIKDIVRELGMSVRAFTNLFKSVTAILTGTSTFQSGISANCHFTENLKLLVCTRMFEIETQTVDRDYEGATTNYESTMSSTNSSKISLRNGVNSVAKTHPQMMSICKLLK